MWVPSFIHILFPSKENTKTQFKNWITAQDGGGATESKNAWKFLHHLKGEIHQKKNQKKKKKPKKKKPKKHTEKKQKQNKTNTYPSYPGTTQLSHTSHIHTPPSTHQENIIIGM